jgi:hypothetical protein
MPLTPQLEVRCDAYASEIFEGAVIAARWRRAIAVAIGPCVWRERAAKDVVSYGSARCWSEPSTIARR